MTHHLGLVCFLLHDSLILLEGYLAAGRIDWFVGFAIYYHVIVVWVQNPWEHNIQSDIGGVAASLNLYKKIQMPPNDRTI